MGNPLFSVDGVDIAKLINQHISPRVLPATLIKVTAGTRTGGQLTGGTNPTSTSYACRGFTDTLDRNRLEGTLVQDGDVAVAIVGDSIASGQVPQPGDKVTISSVTYEIVQVEADPALAVYSCIGRSN